MTYAEVARTFGVRTCDACSTRDHRGGAVDRLGTVHWQRRRMTRPGLRRFLLLIAMARLWEYETMPEWRRIYARNVWVADAATRLHVRLPRTLSLDDRARVRWLLTSEHGTIPASVRRWANREATHAI